MNPISVSNFFPNPNQELLLTSILLCGDTSKEAWKKWDSLVDFDRLDYDTCCLIPSLYAKLCAENIKTSLLPVMRGIYRKYWCKNQLQYRQLSILRQYFKAKKLEAIAIRGTAIALRYYSDYGLRPVEEIDLWIQRNQLAEFTELLRVHNWQSIPNPPSKNSWRFLHHQGLLKLDLHQYALQTGLETKPEELDNLRITEVNLWNQSESIPFENDFLRLLCPEDQLLQVLIQGINPKYVSPYRWIMDAHQIIKKTPNFDWSRFKKQANHFEKQFPLNEMLGYLKSTFELL
jgi:hypothetical protein